VVDEMKIRSAKGLTLVELIVTITLTAVVIAGASSVFFLVSSCFKTGTVSASSQQKGLLVEGYLQRYAGIAYTLSDSEQSGKDGATFSITGNTLKVEEQNATTGNNTITIDGISRIDFSAGTGNSLNYTISFPDTSYTFQGGIVMNNFSISTAPTAVSDGTELFLGTSA
jgi:prepilin-type N-terminal cleavage/methylation domain-containing protein